MQWELDKNRPLTPQLCRTLSVAIATGEYPPGARLPSVREIAAQAGVNPNTAQKSFEELERQGLITSVRSVGWFVRENTAAAQAFVEQVLREKTAEYLRQMELLGLSREEILQIVKEWSE